MKRVAAIVAPLLMLACCGWTSGFLTAVIAGDTPESNDAKACYERGVACQEKGEPDRAIADFTEAVRLQPDFAQAFSRPWLRLPKKVRANTPSPSPTSPKPSGSNQT